MVNIEPYRSYDFYVGIENRGMRDGVTYYVAVHHRGEDDRLFTEAVSITGTAVHMLGAREPGRDWVKFFLDLVAKRARARVDLGYETGHDYVQEITSVNVDHLADQDVSDKEISQSLLCALKTVRQEEPEMYKWLSTDLEGLASILGITTGRLTYVASRLAEQDAVRDIELDQRGYYITNKGLESLETPVTESGTPTPPRVGLALVHPHRQFAAYMMIRDLMTAAREKVVIADPYASVEWLALCAAASEAAELTITYLYEKVQDPDFESALTRYRAQYGNLEVRRSSQLHDRFLSIDNDWYQLGTSLNSLGGKKISTFTPLEELEGKEVKAAFSELWASATTP